MSADDTRRKARSDFVYRRMTAKTISDTHGISEATFGRWKRKAKEDGDDWDVARSAAVLSGQGIDVVVSSYIEDFILQSYALMQQIKSNTVALDLKVKYMASLADGITKVSAAAGKLAPRVSELGVAQVVVQELLDFVKEKFPHHIGTMQELLGPFGDHIARRFKP